MLSPTIGEASLPDRVVQAVATSVDGDRAFLNRESRLITRLHVALLGERFDGLSRSLQVEVQRIKAFLESPDWILIPDEPTFQDNQTLIEFVHESADNTMTQAIYAFRMSQPEMRLTKE